MKLFKYLVGASTLAALVGGCGRKEKEKDVYVTESAPTIVRSGGNIGFKAWDMQSEKSLDIQDAFDLSGAKPTKVEVVSTCFSGDKEFKGTSGFGGGEQIKVFRLVPRAALASSMNGDLACAFEVILFNEAGSRHIFKFSSSKITDSADAAVEIEISGNRVRRSDAAVALKSSELNGVLIRHSNIRPSTIQVLCADLSTSSQRFEKVADLSSFNYENITPLDGASSAIAVEKPIQNCRIGLFENNRLYEISARFQLTFIPKPLEISVNDSFYRDTTNADNFGDIYKAANENFLKFSEITVRNSSDSARFLSINTTYLEIIHQYYYMPADKSRVQYQYSDGGSKFDLQLPEGSLVKQDGPISYFRLAPGASATVLAYWKPTYQPVCRDKSPILSGDLPPDFEIPGKKPWQKQQTQYEYFSMSVSQVNLGYKVQFREQLHINELDANGSTYISTPVTVGRPVFAPYTPSPPETMNDFDALKNGKLAKDCYLGKWEI